MVTPRQQRNPLLRAGLPLLALVVLGSVGLSQLLKARREERSTPRRRRSPVAGVVVQGKTEVNDARRSADDLRLPAAVRRRKSPLDLEEEARVREVYILLVPPHLLTAACVGVRSACAKPSRRTHTTTCQ